MGDKKSRTEQNLEKLFTEESVAAARSRVFALKAKKEGFSHIAALFAAVAESRSVHARRFLRLLRGTVGTTEDNLKEVFENDEKKKMFARCAADAERDGMKIVEHGFEQTLKVERRISSLHGYASEDRNVVYHVCGVCGHVHVGDEAPGNCPICNAIESKFKRIEA